MNSTNTTLESAEKARVESPLKVVFLSTSWDFNPYQKLLIESLEKKGFEVRSENPGLIFCHRFWRDRPDIIHIQFLQYFLAARFSAYSWLKFILFTFQVLVLRLMRISLVWTVHEWIDKVTEDGSHNVSPLKAKIIGRVLGAAITHCDSSNRTMVEELGLSAEQAGKVFTVPHANYIGAYSNQINREAAREQLALPAEEMVFLYFGSIHRSKGVLDAIAAFKQIEHPLAKLIIAGKPRLSIRQEILEQISGQSNIFFVDPPEHIPDDAVQLYMNASDIVVLPYKVFTTSGVALLAMSFAKACIVPNAGFFKDIFDSSRAFLYDPTVTDGLRESMEAAITQRDRLPQMGQANLETAQVWSWDCIAQQTIKVYRFALL